MFLFSFRKKDPQSDDYFNLAPRFFKWIGLGLFILSFFCKSIIHYFHISYFLTHSYSTTLLGTKLFLGGLFFIAFSKNKHEDEIINRMRLKSMAQAIVAVILTWTLASDSTMYGDLDQYMVEFVVLCTFLSIYLMIFNIRLYKNNRKYNKINKNEKLDKSGKGQEEHVPGGIGESPESIEVLDKRD